jgi:acyl carrier protein
VQNEMFDRVREIVATIFEVPLAEVTGTSSPESIERWDSLGRLLLLVELEQEFGVQLPPEQAEQMVSVAAIAAILNEYDVPLDSARAS